MSSVFDHGAPESCPAPFNLTAHVLAAGQACPDKIALAVLNPTRAERWSFGRLRAAVLGCATGLLASGLKPGDILLMRLGNTVDFPVAFLGAIAAGIVPVPTSTQLTSPEVLDIIAHLNPSAILRAPDVACPDPDLVNAHIRVLDSAAIRDWASLPEASFDMGDPNRLAYIIYTSGTSGVPRAVGHAHRAIWARRMMINGWYGLTPDDRLMHAGAFNWTYTLGTGLLDPWTLGATALIPAAGTDAGQLALLMKRHEATIFAAAPGVYRNILKYDMPQLPKLRHGLSAGEKLSAPLRDGWSTATGTPVFEAYGMSECSTFISTSPSHPAQNGSLGQPQTGRRIAILDPDGQPVPRGTPGVIAVHRSDPGLMLGYVGAKQASEDRYQGDWFVTGDQGMMTETDHVHYLGRADDMMNAGGYRVSPIEVEHALADLPGMTEIGVTDIEIKPDVRVIAAFYVSDSEIPESTLFEKANATLARYKQPRLFVRLPHLPRNANGKLIRRALGQYAPKPQES